MIELAQTLLPNLPEKLEWVYGVIYLFMTLAFLILILLPFFIIISMIKHKKRKF